MTENTKLYDYPIKTFDPENLLNEISDEDLQEMEDQKEEVWDAVNRGESVYLSKRGSLITEERYCDFEDMAGSVGLPAGSEVERFVEIKKVRPARKGNQ
jgi:hypothetical protein